MNRATVYLICAAISVLTGCASAAPAPSPVWLQLDWTGGMPPAIEHLTIYADGRVSLVLGSSRANGYIGTFELTLPKARFAELKQAVKEANLRGMKDEYRPWYLQTDYTHVTITVNDELGTKQVRAHSASIWYPRPLRRLFDLSNEARGLYPGGILSKLIDDVSAKPLAAIGVRFEVPKRPIRAGEPFNADVVVRNVGTEPVVLPSEEAKAIGDVLIFLGLDRDPAREFAQRFASAHFGAPEDYRRDAWDDAATADSGHVVRLEPGREWRIRVPEPLVAPSPGQYEITDLFIVRWSYPSAILSAKLGARFVSGGTRAEPLTITVAK